MHTLKSRPHAARLGAGAAALALAAASAVAVSTPAAAADKHPAGMSSAYGIKADLAVAGTPLLDVGPIPYVQSKGQKQEETVVEIPAQPLLNLKVLTTKAHGAQAEAKLVELRALHQMLKADLLVAKCKGGEGSSTLAKVSVGGKTLVGKQAQPKPNTTVRIPPEQLKQLEQVAAATVTLNKQVETDNGGIKVTALELKADLVSGTATKTVSVSSVKCSGAGDSSTEPPSYDGPKDDGPKKDGPGKAPKPTPVTGNLPVTG